MHKGIILFVAFFIAILFSSCENPKKEEDTISYCNCIGMTLFKPPSKESKEWVRANECKKKFQKLLELDTLSHAGLLEIIETECPEVVTNEINVCACVLDLLNETYQDTANCRRQIKTIIERKNLTQQSYIKTKGYLCWKDWVDNQNVQTKKDTATTTNSKTPLTEYKKVLDNELSRFENHIKKRTEVLLFLSGKPVDSIEK